jgi:hypothetical protein
MKRSRVLSFIEEVDNSNPVIRDIFLNGSCFNFYHILKVVFPSSVCYYSQVAGHVITRIGDCYYDITGEVLGVDDYVRIDTIWSKGFYNDEKDFKKGAMYVVGNKDGYVRVKKSRDASHNK